MEINGADLVNRFVITSTTTDLTNLSSSQVTYPNSNLTAGGALAVLGSGVDDHSRDGAARSGCWVVLTGGLGEGSKARKRAVICFVQIGSPSDNDCDWFQAGGAHALGGGSMVAQRG